MADAAIGFIGGSGMYDIGGLSNRSELDVETPFGSPSDKIIVGELGGARVAFLARHGAGHRLSPSELPARANIFALKTLGVRRIVSISAVGSLREEMAPRHIVAPDQLIDRTRERPSTFFGDGLVAHVGFADPFCADLRRLAVEAAASAATVHDGGTYVAIEGPQFSTRAESEMHRSWGASVVGMTALPEARLAREAEMCYATLAFVTDYDVWRSGEADVSVDLVIQNLAENAANARRIVERIAATATESGGCACDSALENAIITSRDSIPRRTREKLAPLLDKYLG